MWILQHSELTFLFILSVFLFVPYYAFLASGRIEIDTRHHVHAFFLIWLALFTLEYFILGPYSFIAVDTDSRNIAFLYYLARLHDGGQFAHAIAGGQDAAIILPGVQFVSIERLLAAFFPPWLTLLTHKAYVGALGFAGSYLLARRVVTDGLRFPAFAAAAVFPVSHVYLGNYSVEFGPGFAAIPLAAYAAVYGIGRKNGLALIVVAGTLLALAPPMKVFPAALIAVAGVLLLREDRHVIGTAAAFAFYVALSVLNWHEVIFGIYQLVELTTRGFDADADVTTLADAVTRLASRLYRYGVVTAIFAVSLIVLVLRGDAYCGRAFAVAILVVTSFMAAVLFPWQVLGLGFINRIEHAYMLLSISVLVIPIAARAASSNGGKRGTAPGRLAAALLAVALCMLSWNKFLNAAWFLALGGQQSVFGFQALQEPTWRTANYRTVTIIDTPPTTVTASYYGLESFDGAALLNPKAWNDYWAAVKGLSLPVARVATRPGLDWRHWDGKTYHADAAMDLKLLAVANVGYVVSPLPLSPHPALEPLVTADREDWAKTRPGFYTARAEYIRERLRRMIDPGRLHVYRLKDALPRVFAAAGIETIADGAGTESVLARVADVGLDRRIVVRSGDAQGLAATPTLEVLSTKTRTDGYDVTVRAPDGGVLVVNNVHLPFWNARADGQPVGIVPANGVQMAIAIPVGAERIDIDYHRPTVRDRVLNW